MQYNTCYAIKVLLLLYSTTTQRDSEMTTYRVTYMNNFARQLLTLEAKDEAQLLRLLDMRCINESQIVSIK